MPDPILYRTPDMVIGKHRWRCVVYQHRYYGRCTRYEWRRVDWADVLPWECEESWPTYNDHDGAGGGLPKGLRSLFRQHKRDIHEALGLPPAPDGPQLTLAV